MILKSCRGVMILVSAACAAPCAGESLEAGKELFSSECIACHAFECNRSGPKLAGLFGRKAGSVSDFSDYTDELRNSGIVWSEKTLNVFLKDPGRTLPGTLMALAGRIEDEVSRSNLIAFLKSGDTSLDLCF